MTTISISSTEAIFSLAISLLFSIEFCFMFYIVLYEAISWILDSLYYNKTVIWTGSHLQMQNILAYIKTILQSTVNRERLGIPNICNIVI